MVNENNNNTNKIKIRKKFANCVNKFGNVLEINQKIKTIDAQDFCGDIYLNNFIKISEPYILENGLCIQNTNYKWLEFYNYNSKIRLTAIYNEKNDIVEWYFDIAREIGKENGIPYEDDMYLDVVLKPNGEIILLDENELEEALIKTEITKQEYDESYKLANELMKTIQGKELEIQSFTDKYLNEIL